MQQPGQVQLANKSRNDSNFSDRVSRLPEEKPRVRLLEA